MTDEMTVAQRLYAEALDIHGDKEQYYPHLMRQREFIIAELLVRYSDSAAEFRESSYDMWLREITTDDLFRDLTHPEQAEVLRLIHRWNYYEQRTREGQGLTFKQVKEYLHWRPLVEQDRQFHLLRERKDYHEQNNEYLMRLSLDCTQFGPEPESEYYEYLEEQSRLLAEYRAKHPRDYIEDLDDDFDFDDPF